MCDQGEESADDDYRLPPPLKEDNHVDKTPQVLNTKVMVFNTGRGTPSDTDDKIEEPIIKKHPVVRDIIEMEDPDVVLVQESSIKICSICPQEINDRLYESASDGKDVGVLYDSKSFELDKRNTCDEFRELMADMIRDGQIREVEFSRKRVAILVSKKPPHSKVLYVSWHGRNSGHDKRRLSELDDVLRLMAEYRKKLSIPLMIFGGDLNVDIRDKIGDTDPGTYYYSDNNFLFYYKYIPTDRRHNIKPYQVRDHILTSRQLLNAEVRAVDPRSFISKRYPEVNCERAYRQILDHDPLIATFSWQNDEQLLKNGKFKHKMVQTEFDSNFKPSVADAAKQQNKVSAAEKNYQKLLTKFETLSLKIEKVESKMETVESKMETVESKMVTKRDLEEALENALRSVLPKVLPTCKSGTDILEEGPKSSEVDSSE